MQFPSRSCSYRDALLHFLAELFHQSGLPPCGGRPESFCEVLLAYVLSERSIKRNTPNLTDLSPQTLCVFVMLFFKVLLLCEHKTPFIGESSVFTKGVCLCSSVLLTEVPPNGLGGKKKSKDHLIQYYQDSFRYNQMLRLAFKNPLISFILFPFACLLVCVCGNMCVCMCSFNFFAIVSQSPFWCLGDHTLRNTGCRRIVRLS